MRWRGTGEAKERTRQWCEGKRKDEENEEEKKKNEEKTPHATAF